MKSLSSPFIGLSLDYWRDRLLQHTDDTYLGIPMLKFPEDLRTYEHLFWLTRPTVCIELGSHCGGSALWFRDRLAALKSYGAISQTPLVISIDMDVRQARSSVAKIDRSYNDTIVFLQGDVTDPALPGRVSQLIPANTRCMVIEDSAHTYVTTKASLHGFWKFVTPGCFFVVEDGCVDVPELRIHENWPIGVLPAVREWLLTDMGKNFVCRRDLELYGITCHPEGYLERKA